MNYRSKLLTLLCALLCLAAPSTYAAERGNAVLIEGVTLIDGTGKPAQSNTWVLIEAGRFAQISHAPLRVGRHVARVDGRGKFLIPGMMDVHIHLLGGGAWRDSSAQSDRAVDFDVGARTTTNVREIAGVWKAGVAIDRAALQLPINGRP